MPRAGQNHYKAIALLTCIFMTFIYIRAPQNDSKASVQPGSSKYDDLIEQRKFMDKIERMEQNLNKIPNKNEILASNDLELRFNARQNLLQRQCAHLGSEADQMIEDWGDYKVQYLYLGKKGDARVCKHFKSGYSSWKTMLPQLKKETRKGKDDPVIITVRHPLVRLLSAWKDKYLGGSPLYMFDEAWIKETKTIENWAKRWYRYWMLAAFSTGKIKTPKSLQEGIKKRKRKNIYAAAKNLNLDMNNFRNISFTFEEFLRHITWTYEHRIPNVHWLPTIVECDLCNLKYDYILHLENSTEEVPYVLKKLGFENKQFARSHPSHSTLENESVPKTKQKTYADYYNEVPKDIFDRIMNLYGVDFDILGYPKQVP